MARKEKDKEPAKKAVVIEDFGNWVDGLVEQSEGMVESTTAEIRWISAYNVAVNLALSGHPEKGLPLGKIINLEGESDTGKTLLGLTIMREAQSFYKSMFQGIVIDSEKGMEYERTASMGMFVKRKPKNKNNPQSGEDTTGDPRAGTFQIIRTNKMAYLADEVLPSIFATARANPGKVFIMMIDSMSMMMTTHEGETDFDTRDMARAVEIRKLLRYMNGDLPPNMMILLVHHQSTRISTNGMPLPTKQGSHDKDISGGKASKYVPSVRIEIGYGGKIKNSSGDIIGQTCKIEVIKTRLFKPMIKAEVVIDHNRGFTQLGGLFDQLLQLGIVVKENQTYYTCPPLFGEKKFTEFNLMNEVEKPENAQQVVQQIVERMSFSAFGEGENVLHDDEKGDEEDERSKKRRSKKGKE